MQRLIDIKDRNLLKNTWEHQENEHQPQQRFEIWSNERFIKTKLKQFFF